MRILSNFDTTQAKKLQEQYSASFGEDKVLLVRKSQLVRYVQILIPLIGFILLAGIAGYLLYTTTQVHRYMFIIYRCVIVIRLIMLVVRLCRRYVDFQMDFLIVTPKEIIKYDQQGILSRTSENLAVDKIKTMTVKKEGFLASFFDIGSLVFLAEGQNEQGDIVMDSVDAIDAIQKQIKHIIGQDAL